MSCSTCGGEGVRCDRCRGRRGRWAHRWAPAGFDPLSAPLRGGFAWETCSTCDGIGRVECPDCGAAPDPTVAADPDPPEPPDGDLDDADGQE